MSYQAELERLLRIAESTVPEWPELNDRFQRANDAYQAAQKALDATKPQYVSVSSGSADWATP